MGQQENNASGGASVNMEVASLVGHVLIDTVENGKSVTLRLDNFGFDDWSTVQDRFIRQKRARMIQAADDYGSTLIELAEPNTPERLAAERRAKSLREEAMSAASRVTGITEEDFREMVSNSKGVAMFLWVMIERRYPSRFSVVDVEKMLTTNEVTVGAVEQIIASLNVALGMAGNSQGQSR